MIDFNNPEKMTDEDKILLEYVALGVAELATTTGLSPEEIFDLQFADRNLTIVVQTDGVVEDISFEFGDRLENGVYEWKLNRTVVDQLEPIDG